MSRGCVKSHSHLHAPTEEPPHRDVEVGLAKETTLRRVDEVGELRAAVEVVAREHARRDRLLVVTAVKPEYM